jgi:hypothetical protein
MKHIFAVGLVLSVGLLATGLAHGIGGPAKAVGTAEYPAGFLPGSVRFSLVAKGTPAKAHGKIKYRRDVAGFDARAKGKVTCYRGVGSQGYFSGTFKKTFFSGPTEINTFYGTVIDGAPSGVPDKAVVQITQSATGIACDDPGIMAFLDSTAVVVTDGNIKVRPAGS